MDCSFIPIDNQSVRCLHCGQQIATTHRPDRIRARCSARVNVEANSDRNLPAIVPRLGRAIRAVMITPGLQMGGAEIWVRTMVTEMDPQRVSWQSVLLAHPFTQINDKLIRPIAATTRVAAPHAEAEQPCYSGLIERFPSRRDAAIAALNNADVVVCWAVGGVLQELVADFRGPVVAVSHGVCRWTRADMQLQINRGATHAVAVGSLAAAVCPDPSLTHVIFNGVNPARVEPRRLRDEVRAKWGLDQDTIIVGYVGRFGPEKNAPAAAMAVGNLPSRYHAVLVGEAANLTTMNEFQNLVTFFAGARVKIVGPTDDVGDVYAAIDVLVMASPAEGCSLTVIEAWLAGVPVVSTPVGIVTEMELRHGQMVFSVPIDPTREELACAVRNAAHAGRNSEVSQRAKRVAHEHLTAKCMTDNWASYLEEVVSQRRTIMPTNLNPRVSIVVPAWNEATRIEKSLRSIMGQTFQDFELIVVDDGSSDNTAAIARRILAGRTNTTVLQKSNGGTGSALNRGFELARGEYLTWWSADCWVYSHWLEVLIKCLDENPEIVMAYGDWEYFDERNGVSNVYKTPEFDKHRLLKECYVGPCWLFRRSAKETVGPYLEEPCEDYDMHLRLAEVGPFQHVDGVLGVWRNHALNVSNRLISNPEPTQWQGQAGRIQARHRERTKSIRAAFKK